MPSHTVTKGKHGGCVQERKSDVETNKPEHVGVQLVILHCADDFATDNFQQALQLLPEDKQKSTDRSVGIIITVNVFTTSTFLNV